MVIGEEDEGMKAGDMVGEEGTNTSTNMNSTNIEVQAMK